MKHTITFDDDDLKVALKTHFKIKGIITFYHIRSIFGNNHTVEYNDTECEKK